MSAPRSHPTGPVRALGYVRVSTAGQVDSGAGLDAQRAALEVKAGRQGWTLEIATDAGLSGATMRRPALTESLARLDRGDTDVLIAAKLDRVSRSVKDFAVLLERAQRKGWRVVLLDLGDTSSASGEMVANMIASAAQYERRLISQRTREGLAAKRAAGVRLGRPGRTGPRGRRADHARAPGRCHPARHRRGAHSRWSEHCPRRRPMVHQLCPGRARRAGRRRTGFAGPQHRLAQANRLLRFCQAMVSIRRT